MADEIIDHEPPAKSKYANKRPVIACKQCGTMFKQKRRGSAYKYDQVYCSMECRDTAKKQNVMKPINTICACGCGKLITTKSPFDYGNGRPIRFLWGHRATRPSVSKSCVRCGVAFECKVFNSTVRKYCGLKCAAQSRTERNRPRDRKRFREDAPIAFTANCEYCGKEFAGTYGKRKDKGRHRATCSPYCHGQLISRTWHNGRPMNRAAQRRHLLATRENKCERCGYCRYVEVLEVHHRDGNGWNTVDTNLVLLCPTCHREGHFEAKTGPYTKRKGRKRKEYPEMFVSLNEQTDHT